jgi:pimeloyl-ACP methyl ester carboxylesterase
VQFLQLPVIRQLANATFWQLLITASVNQAESEAFHPLPVVAAHHERVLEINMTHGNLEAWAGEMLAANGVVAQIDRGLTSIEAPAVVIQGEGDELVKPIHGRELAAALSNSRLVMLYGGHMQPYDHPAAIAAAVQSISGKR